VAGACSPTKPDSPITSTRPPVTTTRPPQGAPSPTLPGTSDDCMIFLCLALTVVQPQANFQRPAVLQSTRKR
jgi:hypothetical protein